MVAKLINGHWMIEFITVLTDQIQHGEGSVSRRSATSQPKEAWPQRSQTFWGFLHKPKLFETHQGIMCLYGPPCPHNLSGRSISAPKILGPLVIESNQNFARWPNLVTGNFLQGLPLPPRPVARDRLHRVQKLCAPLTYAYTV